MIKILSLAAVGLSGITMASTDMAAPAVVQYGALGLCGSVVFFLCRYLLVMTELNQKERLRMVESLEKKDSRNEALLEKNTMAYNRLADLLSDRPCLYGDTRSKNISGGPAA